ncbi:hypothetical protein EV284_3492 [Streptomyces sp. BK022]|uniref:hypothetical protein n=1 Tax=Streptomyces sp. BK022 TaxID=2512123 RepID=UPI0010295F8B|nr:hypothetical protein [Streptomyces sp. BK022]RZU36009.1 hypothetical protein EV284_3492 [Streptomyces sp. BK022]
MSHRTAYDEALDAMLEAGISRGRADELLHAVWEQGKTAAAQPKGEVVLAPGEVYVKDLVVGDIVEERFPHWFRRKIVVKITDKSAVFRTDNGQDGRAALTSKRKGKVIDNKVTRVGHYDLTDELLGELSLWHSMGDLRRARWRRGLLEELPPFYEIFGYSSPEELPFWDAKPGETVDTVTIAGGVRVNIKRYDNEQTVVDGKTINVTCWGASVVDPDHDHEFAVLGWRYRDQDTARKTVDMLDHAIRGGYNLEMAVHTVCNVGNDNLPTIDRWREKAKQAE